MNTATLALSHFFSVVTIFCLGILLIGGLLASLFFWAKSPSKKQKTLALQVVEEMNNALRNPTSYWWTRPSCEGFIHLITKDGLTITSWASTRGNHATLYTIRTFDWHHSPVLDVIEKKLIRLGWTVSRASSEEQPPTIAEEVT